MMTVQRSKALSEGQLDGIRNSRDAAAAGLLPKLEEDKRALYLSSTPKGLRTRDSPSRKCLERREPLAHSSSSAPDEEQTLSMKIDVIVGKHLKSINLMFSTKMTLVQTP